MSFSDLPPGLQAAIYGAVGVALVELLRFALSRAKESRDERKELRDEVARERDLRRASDTECDRWREKARTLQSALDEKNDSLTLARDIRRQWQDHQRDLDELFPMWRTDLRELRKARRKGARRDSDPEPEPASGD